MLPTNRKIRVNDILWFHPQGKLKIYQLEDKDIIPTWIVANLYILSDDEIKEGNWYLFDNMINKADTDYSLEVGKFIKAKKIIASTNSSLSINQCDGCNAGIPVNKNNIHEAPYPSGNMVCQKYKYEFPKLPQHFIEYYVKEYNNGNVVKEVMVEYSGCDCEGKYVPDHRIQDGCGLRLKLNSDNTINIKLIKESWTREEVIVLVKSIISRVGGNENSTFIKDWIKDNL